MHQSKNFQYFIFSIGFFFFGNLNAQINSGVYLSDKENVRHELKINNNYLILSIYETSPAKFIKTLGGFCGIENDTINVQLEFNSNFEKDSITQMHYKFEIDEDILTLYLDEKLEFNTSENLKQELDGQWLFGTRGPDEGQERRGDSKPRKTLKYLQDGRFQWIAYNIETMKFSGTGGGSFTSKDGVYQENIEFFSRDNSRVGAVLKFEYELKGDDWHHQGKNSKGEPMYEIWMRRMISSQ